MTDTLAAGQQTVGELLWRQMHIARDVLEPLHPIARGALELEHFDVALLVIRAERGVEIIRRGHVLDE